MDHFLSGAFGLADLLFLTGLRYPRTAKAVNCSADIS
jgi:hypothetical protein